MIFYLKRPYAVTLLEGDMGDLTIIESALAQSEWPDWALEAWYNGTFFATATEIVKRQEIELGHAEATIITLRRELNQ